MVNFLFQKSFLIKSLFCLTYLSLFIGTEKSAKARAQVLTFLYQPLPKQYYSTPLYGPGPAWDRKGEIGIKPMMGGSFPEGSFAPNGDVVRGSTSEKITESTLIKIGLTDHLTLAAKPSFSYGFRGKGVLPGHSQGMQFNDLPVELRYRFGKHYSPSISTYLGFNAPTGAYTNLASSTQGVGRGAWSIRMGVESQLAFPFFKRQMRVRLWARGNVPISATTINNISAYGTTEGFHGHAHAGTFGDWGIAPEFGITKNWVVALSLYEIWGSGDTVTGNGGSWKGDLWNQVRKNSTGWQTEYFAAPGIEYNWTSGLGALLGVTVPLSGHSVARSVIPSLMINYRF